MKRWLSKIWTFGDAWIESMFDRYGGYMIVAVIAFMLFVIIYSSYANEKKCKALGGTYVDHVCYEPGVVIDLKK